MAAPNTRALTVATLKSKVTQLTASIQSVTDTVATGQCVSVDSIYLGNVHASANQTVTMSITKSGQGDVQVGPAWVVPFGMSLVPVDESSPIRLEEGDVLNLKSTAANLVVATTSYKVLS